MCGLCGRPVLAMPQQRNSAGCRWRRGQWTHCVNIGWGHGGRRRNRLVLKVSKICALIFTILREGTFYCKQVFKLAWLSIKIIGR